VIRVPAVRAVVAVLSSACALLGLVACDVTDIVAYRTMPAECVGPSCPAMDAGRDAASDASDDTGVDTGIDAGIDTGVDTGVDTGTDSGPSGPCAAATCQDALSCAAPIPRAIVGDSCGAQPWAAPAFQHALCSCGDYVSEFPLTITQVPAGGATPVAVDGNLTAGGRVEVAGPVFVGGALALVGEGSLSAHDVQADTATPRCDCGEDVVLTPAHVLALAPSNPPGFDPTPLENIATDQTIPLACGSYRVPRIAGPSALNLTIEGHVVLIVEGDIELDASLEATLAPGALLELFVLGHIRVAGALSLGGDDDQVKVYALGSGTMDLNDETFIAGPFYAPNAELVTRGDLTTTGPIFVRRLSLGGAVLIRYDAASASALSCDG
jgi:hypothetical protein